jgi:hypothetical protein
MAITKVNAGDTILATQQNTIVDGIEHATTGHKHTGAADGAPLLIAQGTAGARPAASQIGRLYYSTDTDIIERDNGSTWDIWGYPHQTVIGTDNHHTQDHASRHAVNGADPLSVGTPSNISTANSPGTANNFPRLDHIHNHPSGLGANLHHNQSHVIGGADHSADSLANISTKISDGTIILASQAEAEAGIENTKRMTPLRVAQAIAALESAPTTIVKSANETVNNSTTLQNDDDLLFSVAANEKWSFISFIFYSSGTTPDIKFAFTVPSGATIDIVIGVWSTTGSLVDGTSVFTGTGGGAGVVRGFCLYGKVLVGATPGNVQLQWAQDVLEASNTIVHEGSTIIGWK